MLVAGFDYTGYFVAFVVCACCVPVFAVMYVHESRGRRRPDHMLRYRMGVPAAIFLALVTALRRFVIHQ